VAILPINLVPPARPKLPIATKKRSIQVIRNVIQITIRPRPLDRLRQDRLVTYEMPICRTRLHDHRHDRLIMFRSASPGRSGHFRDISTGGSTSSPAARPATALAARFLLRRLWVHRLRLGNRRRRCGLYGLGISGSRRVLRLGLALRMMLILPCAIAASAASSSSSGIATASSVLITASTPLIAPLPLRLRLRLWLHLRF
jgi:hypothetical protein